MTDFLALVRLSDNAFLKKLPSRGWVEWDGRRLCAPPVAGWRDGAYAILPGESAAIPAGRRRVGDSAGYVVADGRVTETWRHEAKPAPKTETAAEQFDRLAEGHGLTPDEFVAEVKRRLAR